jgi:hypothetical protein
MALEVGLARPVEFEAPQKNVFAISPQLAPFQPLFRPLFDRPHGVTLAQKKNAAG